MYFFGSTRCTTHLPNRTFTILHAFPWFDSLQKYHATNAVLSRYQFWTSSSIRKDWKLACSPCLFGSFKCWGLVSRQHFPDPHAAKRRLDVSLIEFLGFHVFQNNRDDLLNYSVVWCSRGTLQHPCSWFHANAFTSANVSKQIWYNAA